MKKQEEEAAFKKLEAAARKRQEEDARKRAAEEAARKKREEDATKRAAGEAAKTKQEQEVAPHESAWLRFASSRARQCAVVDPGVGITGSGDRPDSSHSAVAPMCALRCVACRCHLLHSALPHLRLDSARSCHNLRWDWTHSCYLNRDSSTPTPDIIYSGSGFQSARSNVGNVCADQDWHGARPGHICSGAALSPHLHMGCTLTCHICTGTALTRAAPKGGRARGERRSAIACAPDLRAKSHTHTHTHTHTHLSTPAHTHLGADGPIECTRPASPSSAWLLHVALLRSRAVL